MAPKLIGIVKISYPFQRRCAPEEGLGNARERIISIAFDTDGQPWGLVERLTSLDPVGMGDHVIQAGRLNVVRWIKFPALPFSEEIFDPDMWHVENGGRG